MSKRGIPLWRQTIDNWPNDAREDWEERAAIKEHCGGMSREKAELMAFDELAPAREPQFGRKTHERVEGLLWCPDCKR